MDLQQGIYESVINNAMEQALKKMESEGFIIERVPIAADCADVFSHYLQSVLRRGLITIGENAKKCLDKSASDSKKNLAALKAEIDACNLLLDLLSSESKDNNILEWRIGESGEQLQSVWSKVCRSRPKTSMATSSMFTGGGHSYPLYEELCREIETSDEVDLVVSFIKVSGLNMIYDSLKKFTEYYEGKLRVVTTTYMKATDAKAIRMLSELPNTEIRISYDENTTRLHAKSYIFRRNNGFDTVFIGSSNLSGAAVSDGMEWNVKLTGQDAPQIIDAVVGTFDSYWDSRDFETYNKEDYEKLCYFLDKKPQHSQSPKYVIKPNPFAFQKQILDELQAERELFGSYRNLLVAATGTGKTMIAAFDYERFVDEHPNSSNRLLYVVHRKEILEKSLFTFRSVLNDPNFGWLAVEGKKPEDYSHLFVSVATFNSIGLDNLLDESYYDFIIVDEAHHIVADSYQKIVNHFKPKILLGLTATPERMDGKDILHYFNGRFAAEIRLPEAIDRQFLVPFHYYMVTDPTDISKVSFERGKYNEDELAALYINNDVRLNAIINAVNTYLPDLDEIKCLGFCVNKAHAKYMAEAFSNYYGDHSRKIANGQNSAIYIVSDSDEEERKNAPKLLSSGKTNFIFTVDLYNEGVDIKDVNAVLFLRPTESMTIFVQQLGRGLRKSKGKSELTVLDFVGQASDKYRFFEKKLSYLSSSGTVSVKDKIENGFVGLPLGCSIKIEKIAKKYVLKCINIQNKNTVVSLVKSYYDHFDKIPTLTEFLTYTGNSIQSIYSKRKNTFFGSCKLAIGDQVPKEEEELFSKAFFKFSSIDSRSWIEKIQNMLKTKMIGDSKEEQIYQSMFYYTFYNDIPTRNGYSSMSEFFKFVFSKPHYCNELYEILNIRLNTIKLIEKESNLGYDCGLKVHCSYFREQILAGLGINNETEHIIVNSGVRYWDDLKTDILIFDLIKSEKDFTPRTMYQDYAISEDEFHWQSQNDTWEGSDVGKRYVGGTSNVILFARILREYDGNAMPYIFLGRGHYVSHRGNRPMSIVWKMEYDLPGSVISNSPVGL